MDSQQPNDRMDTRNRIRDTEENRIIETVRGIGYVIRDKTRR